MDKNLFYQCLCCDLLLLEMNSPPPQPCHHDLTLLEPNITKASKERHIPVLEFQGHHLHVNVGSVSHPMTLEHSILWIFVQTRNGGMYVELTPEDLPEADFMVSELDVLGVYAYCDVHGLWMMDNAELDYEETVCSPEFPQGCVG